MPVDIDIAHALTVEGFMEPDELRYLAEAAQRSSQIVEIGSWRGRSACAFAANTLGTVTCVDTWQGRLERDTRVGLDREFLNSFLINTQPYSNILPVVCESLRASAHFAYLGARFDLIFIDATHNYDDCLADIIAWRRLLAPHGILCGHDYGHVDWPGVKRAVDAHVPKFRLVADSIWTTEGCE